MKICNFCGNKNFNEKNVQYFYKYNTQFLIINAVPCEECEFCGEQYFKAEVLKRIENDFRDIYSGHRAVRKEIRVPIEEFVAA